MVQSLSRRRWLLATAMMGVAHWSDATADDGLASPTKKSVADVAAKKPSLSTTRPPAMRGRRDLVVRLKPTDPKLDQTVVTSIATDPRGELLAVSGDDHAIRILDGESLDEIQVLSGHRDLIRTLAFSPDGNRLISAGNEGRILLWDRDADFENIQTMQNAPALACVRFSPSGKEIAAVGFDSNVYLINQVKSDSLKLDRDCKDLRAVAYRDEETLRQGNGMIAVAGRSGHLHLFDRTRLPVAARLGNSRQANQRAGICL